MNRKYIDKVMWLLLLLTLIFPVYGISDSNSSNNHASVEIDVINTQNFNVVFVPVKDLFGEYNFNNYEDAVSEQINFTTLLYPLAESKITHNISYVPVTSSFSITAPINKKAGRALKNLHQRLALSGTQYHRAVGVYNSGFINAGGVANSRYPRVVIVSDTKLIATAHEIGHTYGLCDEYIDESLSSDFIRQDGNFSVSGGGCPNHDLNEDGYLDQDVCNDSYCSISDSKTVRIVNELGLRSSSNLKNFMGDVGNWPPDVWIDNQSYNQLLSELQNSPPVFVYNNVYAAEINVNATSNEVSLGSIYLLPGGYVTNQSSFSEGAVMAEMKDSSGNTLQNFSFDMQTELRMLDGNISTLNESSFLIIVQAENITSFTLMLNGSLEEERNATPNTPNITLLSAVGSETYTDVFNVTWNATDADNDTIMYAILLSEDGGSSWTTLDFDLNQTFYEIDNADFTYGENYRIRILATDGVNTGTDESPSSFTIIPPPRVTVNEITEVYSQQERKVFEINTVNDGGQNLSDLAWVFDTGEENISSEFNTSLAVNEDLIILIEYNYSEGGERNISLTAYDDNKSVNDTFVTSTFVGDLRVANLTLTFENGTQRIFNFTAYNVGESTLTGINWTLETGEQNRSANELFNLSAFNSTQVSVPYNYSDSGTYNLRITVWNSFNDYTDTTSIEILDITIDEYELLAQQDNRTVVTFTIKNNLDTAMQGVAWSLDAGEEVITADQNVSMASGEDVIVIIEDEHSTYGDKTLVANATDGSHTAVTALGISIVELAITNFQKLFSNGTLGIFTFDIENRFTTNKIATWSFDTNDTAGTILADQPMILQGGENSTVIFAHDFTTTGERTLAAGANTSSATYASTLNTTLG